MPLLGKSGPLTSEYKLHVAGVIAGLLSIFVGLAGAIFSGSAEFADLFKLAIAAGGGMAGLTAARYARVRGKTKAGEALAGLVSRALATGTSTSEWIISLIVIAAGLVFAGLGLILGAGGYLSPDVADWLLGIGIGMSGLTTMAYGDARGDVKAGVTHALALADPNKPEGVRAALLAQGDRLK